MKPQAAVTRALKVLADPSRRAGELAARLYRLEPQALQPLRSWLDELSAFWDGQLAAFKAHR